MKNRDTNELETNIGKLIRESNDFYKQENFDKAAAKAEKAYSFALHYTECSEVAKKRIEFNLAVIYTASGNYDLAKGWLDKLSTNTANNNDNDDSANILTGVKLRDSALLYTQIGNIYRKNPMKRKQAVECYKIAGDHFGKMRAWQDYCLVCLSCSKVLLDMGDVSESVQMANRIRSAMFYLDANKDRLFKAQLYNDLSTILAYDPYTIENVHYAKKLLLKACKSVSEQSSSPSLFLANIYQNLSAVFNRLEEYQESLKYLELAYALGIDNDCIWSDLKFNEGYARFKLNRDEVNNAIHAFTSSHEYALKSSNDTKLVQSNIYESLEQLASVYYCMSYYDDAKRSLQRAIEMNAKYFGYQSQKCDADKRAALSVEKRLRTKLDLIDETTNIAQQSRIIERKTMPQIDQQPPSDDDKHSRTSTPPPSPQADDRTRTPVSNSSKKSALAESELAEANTTQRDSTLLKFKPDQTYENRSLKDETSKESESKNGTIISEKESNESLNGSITDRKFPKNLEFYAMNKIDSTPSLENLKRVYKQTLEEQESEERKNQELDTRVDSEHSVQNSFPGDSRRSSPSLSLPRVNSTEPKRNQPNLDEIVVSDQKQPVKKTTSPKNDSDDEANEPEQSKKSKICIIS